MCMTVNNANKYRTEYDICGCLNFCKDLNLQKKKSGRKTVTFGKMRNLQGTEFQTGIWLIMVKHDA